MTTKTSQTKIKDFLQSKKILIGILVVIILLTGGWWVWRNQLLDGILVSKYCRKDSDCAFTQCCGCASKCRKICSERPFAVPCECKNNQCVVKQTQQVTVTTDKTEYEQGDTVKYTVKNNKDTPVWIEVLLPPMGAGQLFAIEKKIKEGWTYIGYPSFCALGYEPPEKELIKIESGEEYKESWDQTFCNIVAITMEQPNPPMENLSRGIYRIKYEYSNIERMGIADMVDMYSNEFIIQ